MTPTLHIRSHGPEETQAIGEVIGRQSAPGDIYLLAGPLGSGKTCLTQGIGRGLGVPGYVRSPTFVLMTTHQGRLTLYHRDLDLIGEPEEAWDLGVEEQLSGQGVCVVEWADRAAKVFPSSCCWINLDYGPGESDREVALSPDAPQYNPLLKSLALAFPPPVESGP